MASPLLLDTLMVIEDIVPQALLYTSIILLAGFLAYVLLTKYGLPDPIFLIALGIVMGPVLNILPRAQFEGLAPYIGALALVAIMFESGLGMNLHELVKSARHALTLAILSFTFSTLAGTAFAYYVVPLLGFELSFPQSLLFGFMVGGSSGAVVAAVASKVGFGSSLQVILSLESLLTDVFVIVSGLVVLLALEQELGAGAVATLVASKFSVSIVLGVLFGFFVSSVLYRAREYKHIYIATLSAMLFLYSLAEFLQGNGAVSVLTAGVVLANLEYLPTFLSSEEKTETLKFQRVFLESFHSELTLLIKVFFFVEVGVVFNIQDPRNFIMASVISVLLLFARYPAALLVSKLAKLRRSAPVITAFYARGLAAVVLAFIVAQSTDIPHSQFFVETVSGVVVMTNLILTISYWILKTRDKAVLDLAA